MSDNTEALRLAEVLERRRWPYATQSKTEVEAAAELRRLHALNAELVEALREAHNALELFCTDESPVGQIAISAVMQARAALANAIRSRT